MRPIGSAAARTNLGVILLFAVIGTLSRRVLGIAPFVCYIKACTVMRTAIRAAVKLKVFNISVILGVFAMMVFLAAAICCRFTAADGYAAGLALVIRDRLFGHGLICVLSLFSGASAFTYIIGFNLRAEPSFAVIGKLVIFVYILGFVALCILFRLVNDNRTA